jgi:anti-sigma B factor antagonist
VEHTRQWKKVPLSNDEPGPDAIKMTVAAGTATVVLRGEIDVLTVERLRAALGEALASRPARILVDLAGLTFIDSTGLGALIAGFQRARDAGVGFRLAHATASVRQILVLSGLLEVVELTP